MSGAMRVAVCSCDKPKRAGGETWWRQWWRQWSAPVQLRWLVAAALGGFAACWRGSAAGMGRRRGCAEWEGIMPWGEAAGREG